MARFLFDLRVFVEKFDSGNFLESIAKISSLKRLIIAPCCGSLLPTKRQLEKFLKFYQKRSDPLQIEIFGIRRDEISINFQTERNQFQNCGIFLFAYLKPEDERRRNPYYLMHVVQKVNCDLKAVFANEFI